ncbi:MAG: ABC transporter ATP-binding protein [Gemmatimonadetes bacterium]|nr:ABC transporter ATP-binding protein [Gemmatimonadota bacterium]NNF14687.1 ABC transporter ATP-binding protein [Gemmatimonadota bacterium]NNK62252.1 ABC transporter ATP-binding protein [Gemmatimonadota bacterium]NNL31183.1 ABC transporter ATP-binding protein [Gemmatimonadota bacterium]
MNDPRQQATRPEDRKRSPLLEVRDLQTSFLLGGRDPLVAVDGVSFNVGAGETLAIVGESGSGKSVTALSIMRLLPARVGQITGGSIRLERRELTELREDEMRAVRGKEIGMIFQEPMTSLNPVHTVGAQIAEVMIQHEDITPREARERSIEMLDTVGISEPARRVDSHPHEMSGGMRQRAMIAMALACRPSLLIADEPTTALDVTIQAQILDLMADLQDRLGMAIIFITHDLGVVAQIARRVVVMYAGQVVESGPVEEIFNGPRMPYTAGLIGSIPRLRSSRRGQRLRTIPGNVPSLSDIGDGCRFSNRCTHARPECLEGPPELEAVSGGHETRCFRWRELDLAAEVSA